MNLLNQAYAHINEVLDDRIRGYNAHNRGEPLQPHTKTEPYRRGWFEAKHDNEREVR